MPQFLFESERLSFRELKLTDAKSMYDLNADPVVLKHTGDVPFESLEDAKNFLKNYHDYKENGFGRWAVVSKESTEFIGWCGLKKHNDGMVDVGFRFFYKYWNRGYATEAAWACIKYGFDYLSLQKIYARIAEENTASHKVIEKIGMTFLKKSSVEGLKNALIYCIEK